MNHAEIMELGALAIGALAIIAVLRRGGSTVAAPVGDDQTSTGLASAPTYLTYNQPTSYAGSSVPLNQVGPGGSSSTPCACSQQTVNFASLNSFANYLTGVDEDIVSNYEAQIEAASPSWLNQFFNNTFAPDETAAAQGQFGSLAASA